MRRESSKWAVTGLAWLALGLVALATSTLLLNAEQKKAPPPGSVLVADKGKFNILVNGKSLGREEFEIAPNGANWIAKGTTRVSIEGSPATTVSGTLTLQPDGAPVSYDWSSQAEQTNGARVTFSNGVAKMTLKMQGAHPFDQELTFNSRMVVVLDNNLYHQYSVLAQVYDWARKGEQTFPVLIPQQLTPGTITVNAAGPVTADGRSYEGLTVKTNDIELTLFLDPNHRVMRLEVPASKAAVVRE